MSGTLGTALADALAAQDAGFEVSGELASQAASLVNALHVDDREQAHWSAGFAALAINDARSAEIHFRRAHALDKVQRHQTTLAQRQNVAERQFQRVCNGAVDRLHGLIAATVGRRRVAGGSR